VRLELPSGAIEFLDQGKGPAVLLIHAFPLNSGMWAPQMSALTEQFRVIAPDVRGFGGSQPPKPWTMDELAGDLNRLLDELAVADAAVVGVSMGGYIALAFWSSYPNRVRRLVLSNSRARADNDVERAARNEMIAAIQQSGVQLLPDRMLPRLLQPNPAPEAVREVRRMIEVADPSAAAYAVMAMRDRFDFSTQLQRMRCPAMVVTGENDVIVRAEDARAMADSIPGASFVTIPDSGHLSNLENPEAFNAALLRFLQN
jgi:pimeloyl-ACP methyl ester carboxylesterase